MPFKGQYSYEVRNTVANALIRDLQPYRLVMGRMQEDMSEQEIEDLDSLLEMAPELEVFRKFNRQFYGLFQKDIFNKPPATAEPKCSIISIIRITRFCNGP